MPGSQEFELADREIQGETALMEEFEITETENTGGEEEKENEVSENAHKSNDSLDVDFDDSKLDDKIENPINKKIKWQVRFRNKYGFGRKLFHPYGYITYLNLIALCLALAFFGYNMFKLTEVLVDEIISPSYITSFSVADESNGFSFPYFLICNEQEDTALDLLELCINIDENTKCDLSLFQKQGYVENKTLFDIDSAGNSTGNINCKILKTGTVPGFQFSKVNVVDEDGDSDTYYRASPNSIVVTANVHADRSDLTTPIFGVSIFAFEKYESILSLKYDDDLVSFPNSFSSTELYTFIDLSLTKFDEFGVFSNNYTFLSSSHLLNPKIVQKFGTVENTTMFNLKFGSTQFQLNRKKNASFSRYFGSVGGWIGLLSDGWGMFTLLFLLEKMFVKHVFRKKY